MPIYGRFIMAALGLLVMWKIFRAFQTGTVTSRGVTFDINEQPIFFSLGLAVYAMMVLFCGWLAAGHTPDSFWQLVAPR